MFFHSKQIKENVVLWAESQGLTDAWYVCLDVVAIHKGSSTCWLQETCIIIHRLHHINIKGLIRKSISSIPVHLLYILCCITTDFDLHGQAVNVLGPVVQSVVSLTSSLRVISLTVLADSIHNILIFFAEKMWVAFALQKLLTFFQQKISAYLRINRCKF